MDPALGSSGSSGSSGPSGPILGPALTLGVVLLAGWSAEASGAPLDFAADKDDTPVVHTAQGDVVGVLSTSASGNKFMAFYGIPYAKPPTGDLRFKAPQPADKWEGVLAARREGNMCMQPTSPMKRFAYIMQKMAGLAKTLGRLPNVGRFAAKHMTQMSENCLFLNVYVPGESPPEAPLPVLVFIHGGAFFMGSSDSMMYGADYLVDKGVVVVTLNYRLGPLGFLTTNTTDAPGNAGIKDQRLAMRWVRDNIRAFGGDPARVTIYGESAGSYSVHMHVLSPGSKGLFRAAIMSSSMGPNYYGFRGDGSALSMRLAEALGADPDTALDPAKRVQFLQGVPVRTLYDKMMSAVIQEKDLRTLSPVFPWGLVPEPQDSEDPVLTRHPNDILRDGSFNRVPIMVGLNDKEGSLLVPLLNEAEMQDMANNPVRLVPESMYDKLDEGKRLDLAKNIVDTYFKGKAIGKDTVSELTDVFGDEVLAHGIHLGSRWHAKHATPEAPVFLYFFTLDAFGGVSMLLGADKEIKGAGHADDLGYVFKAHLLDGHPVTDPDRVRKGVARMTELIANFVKEGNPTPPSKSADVDVEWPAAMAGKEQYLEIGDELAVREGLPLKERMEFWDNTCQQVLQDPVCAA